MGFSLRDLMKREKESRKRTNSNSEELNKDKIQKTSQPNDKSDPLKDNYKVDSVKDNLKDNLNDNLNDNLKDNLKENVPESDSKPEFEPQNNNSEPNSLNKEVTSPNELTTSIVMNTSSEDSVDLNVVEETYVLLDDEDSVVSERSDAENKSKVNQTEVEEVVDKVLDENKLVYEQLNTAYCSNLEYEHENILKEVGVDDNLGLLDQFDTDYSENSNNSNVIVSKNFGVSNVSVSKSENLPVGFFDDANVDAKARGKLTAKEAKDKIRELSKKRSTYLEEARYVQEKSVENHREKLRMENDLLDHEETLKQLKQKVSEIKNTLVVDTNDLKVEPESNNTEDKSLEYDLDYDNLSWMSRSII